MNRRRFLLTSLAGVVAAPRSAEAQPATKVPRIAVVLTLYSSSEGAPEGLKDGLRALGYIEGQNIVIEWRSVAGKYDQLGALVTDLVRLKVDVIVADVTRAVLAAKQATTTIPIRSRSLPIRWETGWCPASPTREGTSQDARSYCPTSARSGCNFSLKPSLRSRALPCSGIQGPPITRPC